MGKHEKVIVLDNLLTFCPDYQKSQPNTRGKDDVVRELLGALYGPLFGTLSESTRSKIRCGDSGQKNYGKAAAFLEKTPAVREQILAVWMRWRADSGYGGFLRRAPELLKDPELDEIGSPEENSAFRRWLLEGAGASGRAAQAEFLTTLTLMACTRFFWHKMAAWYPPGDCGIFTAGPDTADDARQLLAQAEDARRHKRDADVIRLLTQYLDEYPCPDSAKGEYLYRISGAYQRLSQDAAAGTRETWARRAEEYLEEACGLDCVSALLEAVRRDGALSFDRERVQQCCDRCRRITRLAPGTPACGEAYWILYTFARRGTYTPPAGENADLYLKCAGQNGYDKAVRLCREHHAVSLTNTLTPAADPGIGVCCINDENELAAVLEATMPGGWTVQYGDLTEAPRDALPRKYFFIHDDQHRNIRQALKLLQSIKDTGRETNGVQLYIRGSEGQVAPLIDTALAYMDGAVIPVHILDDDKRAARYLGRHPLFYPIRHLPEHADAVLDFVIMGDSPCCEWLVREAFWMMTFRNGNVVPRITVLAPAAAQMLARVMDRCPGMAPALLDPRERGDDPLQRQLPRITGIDCPYGDRTQLEQLLGAEHLYIAVDAGTDLENLELATRIREASIRQRVRRGEQNPAESLPVISFRCADPDIACLSRRTVVLNENCGDLWFNNYRLLPFGVLSEQYSWQALTADVLEELSLCIHMQYCGVDPQGDPAARDDALASYYGRSYNRDSSMAVAMSLAYRLYQSNYPGTGRILPPAWDILDPDAFFSEEGLAFLAGCLGGKPAMDDRRKWTHKESGYAGAEADPGSCYAESQALARWEHDRWNRFMISRGWQTATAKQAAGYYLGGNPRQQLYIGRLHPCICPYDQLEPLEKALRQVGLNKNFRKLDWQGILATEQILRREWLAQQRGRIRTNTPKGWERI